MNSSVACIEEKGCPEIALRDVLEFSGNGVSSFVRYMGRLCLSNGARDAAEAGQCRWMCDLLASEVVPMLVARCNEGALGRAILAAHVERNQAVLTASDADGAPPLRTEHVQGTDFSAGQWPLCELAPLELDRQHRCTRIAAVLLSAH
jgi:hypothetical protein